MKKYIYETSEKSYLDLLHEDFWTDTVKWIYKKYPYITPNHLTIMGFLPILFIVILHFSGILGRLSFLLLSVAIIWYLNMDAMDGKLARHSNRSSPTGQVLDHGLDSIAGGLIGIMVCDFLNLDYMLFYALSVVLTSSLFYLTSLKEHITGKMLVSTKIYLDRSNSENMSIVVSTTELLYLVSFMFLFGSLGLIDNVLYFPIGIISLFTLFYLNYTLSLVVIQEYRSRNKNRKNIYINNNSRREREFNKNYRDHSDILDNNNNDNNDNNDNNNNYNTKYNEDKVYLRDIVEIYKDIPLINFVLTQLASLIMYIFTIGSKFQLIMFVYYVSVTIIDLIFLNTLKINSANNVLTKRFFTMTGISFCVIKFIIYLFCVFGVVLGILDSMNTSYTFIKFLDIIYILISFVEILDKAYLVESYFK